MNQEQYIEHEVRLRLNDHKFKHLEQKIDDLRKLIYWVLATGVVSIILPTVLHHFSLT